jgi:hypothetical protein
VGICCTCSSVYEIRHFALVPRPPCKGSGHDLVVTGEFDSNLFVLNFQLSQRLQSNLEDALSVCRKANSGSFMARVHQALECAKEICVLSLCTDPSRYDGSGHVVCLKGEKIRCVAQEWLEKNRHCQVQYDTMLLFPTPFTFSHSCCIL